MKIFEVSRLSSKGQIVIPNSIRKKLSITNGANLAVFTDGENILLKPIQIPKIDTFKNLINRSKKAIKTSSINKKDIPKLIKKTRSKK